MFMENRVWCYCEETKDIFLNNNITLSLLSIRIKKMEIRKKRLLVVSNLHENMPVAELEPLSDAILDLPLII